MCHLLAPPMAVRFERIVRSLHEQCGQHLASDDKVSQVSGCQEEECWQSVYAADTGQGQDVGRQGVIILEVRH